MTTSKKEPKDPTPKERGGKDRASKDTPAPEESKWRRRGRRLATLAVYIQYAVIIAFLLILFIGESSRVTLIALYLPRSPLLGGALVATLLAPFAHRRKVLLPVQIVICLILLFPVMGLSVSTSGHADKPIRLVSYNVHFGKEGRSDLMNELAAMDADVIVMQAAHSSLGDRLRERFPDRTVRQNDELVMMTRLPLRNVEVPPPLADGTPSMFVKYVVDTPGGALRIFNVHPFSPRHALFSDEQTNDNIVHREQQIEGAVTAARSDVPPFLVVGDTNLPTLSAISRRHFAGLTDAFDSAGLGFGYTFPAKRPWMRIDRALGSDGIRFLDVRVGRLGASDHRPIFVDFEITSGH